MPDINRNHLTPVKVFDRPFVASAIKAGYNANENVASLPTSHDASIVENKPRHANHPNYTQQVEHIYDVLQQRAEAEHWDSEMIKTAMSFTEVQLGLKLQEAGGGVKVNEVDLHTLNIDHIVEASKKFEAESNRLDREHLRRGARNQSQDWETYWD